VILFELVLLVRFKIMAIELGDALTKSLSLTVAIQSLRDNFYTF
jgi:hypothetical protein